MPTLGSRSCSRLMSMRGLARSVSNGVLRQEMKRDTHQHTFHHYRTSVNKDAKAIAWCCNGRNSDFSRFRHFSSTGNDENKKETDAEPSTEPVEDDSGNAEEDSTNEPEPTVEETLTAQVKDLKNQLLRSLAEQENTRRIAKRDVDSARSFAVTSFAKGLLDTSDNLSRAMDAVDLDKIEEIDTKAALKTLYEGIQMTDTGLTKAFEKHGLRKFGKAGEVFDPNKHEALFEYADENFKPGTLGQVMKIGFELNGRVIRSAEVGVIKK